MQFKITGRVREKESGLGVRGLMVRAYDKDMLYDDLLGTTITDIEGRFEIVYFEKDFRELFEGKPDIYLVIYAPPSRVLLDSTESVRWAASRHEHFDLEIDRETLGDSSPTRPDDQVEGGISIKEDELIVEKRDGFDIPRLPGFMTGGIPGAPSLPERTQYVALPRGADVLSLKVKPGDPVRLPGKVIPLPVQEPVPDVGTDAKQFGDGFSVDNVHVTFTPPNPKYFKRKQPYPETLVELDGMEDIGAIQMVALKVRPLQYDPTKRSFILYPNLRFIVKYDFEKAKRLAEEGDRKQQKVGEYYIELINPFLQRDLVVSAKDLCWPDLMVLEEVPYVIITDNYSWPESINRGDGTTRAPNFSERVAALPGNLVAEFERLAEWKTSRGMRSRVITVSEIVAGTFGDFTENGFARDLQEVLRNFVKYIHNKWGSLYLLLAGDVNVVPMRRLVGASTYPTIGCSRHEDNPPPEAKCHFISGKAVVKIRPMFTPISTDPLSTMHGGIRIPFDRDADGGRLGWYYTDETDFTTKNEGFTRLPIGEASQYIIVEGPEPVIDDDYYWVRDVNSITSDFYYASLVGPGYSISGKHDFDSNNNGLYGQYHWDSVAGKDVSLDAVDFWPDIWVGRASVETGDQARAFVNKVITYERLETPDAHINVDSSYLQKVLYASDYWNREWQWRQLDTSTPPAEKTFTHEAGTTITKICTNFDLAVYDIYLLLDVLLFQSRSHRLVARRGTTEIIVPYDTSANASNLGWFFTTDDTYKTQSAMPTHFVKVCGPEANIDADSFFWDPTGLERAAEQKENLRTLMNGWYPNFYIVERHYADYFDLSMPPPLLPLDKTTIRNALDNGVHFASLSGHGDARGCCRINIYTRPDFTNNQRYFIMFAHSCSTARPDGFDSLAEVSTMCPDGGAVAYVGNTRYGWTDVGDDYEEYFWGKLKSEGRLGLAAGVRQGTGGMRQIWTSYTQTLFGDPEMPVWTDIPSSYEVSHPSTAARRSIVQVMVRKAGTPLAGHRVTLMGGWTNSSIRPRVFMTKITNSSGLASFSLIATDPAVIEVKITVAHKNFKPYVGTMLIVS